MDNLLLRFRSLIILKWLKNQLIKEFLMKNLVETKKIIRQKITDNIKVKMLKINQKKYILDFLEAKKMTSYYTTVFSIKTKLFILLNKTDNNNTINLVIY